MTRRLNLRTPRYNKYSSRCLDNEPKSHVGFDSVWQTHSLFALVQLIRQSDPESWMGGAEHPSLSKGFDVVVSLPARVDNGMTGDTS